jgi:hypothetical protein
MILVELNGGLGNQMFQYAAGRSLQVQTGLPLLLDTSILDYGLVGKGYTKRAYEIGLFQNVKAERYSRPIFQIGEGYNKVSAVQFKALKFFDTYFRGFETWNETQLIQEPQDEPFPKRIKLEGYFQSQKYFQDSRSVLLADFEFPVVSDDKNKETIQQIAKSSSTVSLHVRRSDYLTAVHKDNHPVCSVQYYEEALSVLKARVGDVRCVVFSDDIPWAKENLQFLGADGIFVSHNSGSSSYEDMRLMSLCSHNIIANSSFSWWGAWLNRSPEKIVIAPAQWFGSKEKTKNLEITPNEWIRV